MDKKKYDELVKKHRPNENKVVHVLIAFTVGGLIGAGGELLSELYAYWFNIPTKDATSLVLITLIFFASLFTALGVFDKMVSFCRCGLIIPITGFAHSMTSAALEYRKEGPIFGLGNNIFKLAGSVILYGIVAAWTFATIRYLFFGGAL